MPKGIFIRKPLTEEHLRNLSLSHKGKHSSPKTEFKKGMTTWNKGKSGYTNSKKLPSPTCIDCKKIISKRKALRCLQCRGNILRGVKRPEVGLKGKDNPNWKGGITPINQAERVRFINSMQKAVFERDNYTCQLCEQKGGTLQVDHIQSWKDYVELRFEMSNCRTLCMNCHYQITFGKPIPKHIKTWGQNLKYSKGGN